MGPGGILKATSIFLAIATAAYVPPTAKVAGSMPPPAATPASINEVTLGANAMPSQAMPFYITDFITRAEGKYGIEVEVGFSIYYEVAADSLLRETWAIGPKPTIPLTIAEVATLEEAIDSLAVCARTTKRLNILKAPPIYHPQDEFDYIAGSTGNSTITIRIAEGIDLDLPTGSYRKLGVDTLAEMVWKTYLHECGHIVSNAILRGSYAREEYDKFMNRERPEWKFVREKKHPLYIPFAKLEGWEVRESMLARDVPDGHVYARPKPDKRMADSATNYAIEEHFAELFSLSVMGSPALRPEENAFFAKIVAGLEANPEKFARKVAEDPFMLLKG